MAKPDKAKDKQSQSSNDGSSFVSRWSQRKQEVQETGSTGDQTDQREVPGDDKQSGPNIPLNSIVPDGVHGRMQTRTAADQLAEQCAREDGGDDAGKKPLTDEDMPALDSLDESSDFSGFLSPGVSDMLRKKALRKLFSGAGFNIRDGLDDYDDDFTSFEGLGDIVTSDMKHREAVKAEKRREAELAAQETEQADAQIEKSEVSDEEPDSVASRHNDDTVDGEPVDHEPAGDENLADRDRQKSVTLGEDDAGDAEKPRSGKSS